MLNNCMTSRSCSSGMPLMSFPSNSHECGLGNPLPGIQHGAQNADAWRDSRAMAFNSRDIRETAGVKVENLVSEHWGWKWAGCRVLCRTCVLLKTRWRSHPRTNSGNVANSKRWFRNKKLKWFYSKIVVSRSSGHCQCPEWPLAGWDLDCCACLDKHREMGRIFIWLLAGY